MYNIMMGELGSQFQKMAYAAGAVMTVLFGVSSAQAQGVRHQLDEGERVAVLYNRLATTSDGKIAQVHPDLGAVIKRAQEISAVPFMITEGCRTPEDQKKAVSNGTSWTKVGRHPIGHAVDMMPVVVKNGDPALIDPHSYKNYGSEFKEIRRAVIAAAHEKGIQIAFVDNDAPHVELDKKAYPPPKFEDRKFCQ